MAQSLNEVHDAVNYRTQWTDAMVKLLLTEINKHVESFTSPVNKQVWKNIAASMNTHGYNLSAENCHVKWIGMKNKYKNIKDANNKTGAAKETWEYYNIINDMLIKKPEIAPLSLASSSRGFKLNNTLNTSDSINIETNCNNYNEENA
ncbi:trihelix transcription factor GT-2-like [Odontomachus brunneus]|uniref:trihelix transcription factor GT-2-like n=1 Tax=Odontomachus brunneus TaxID=486640 RepID=UPI0013F293F5|nr:trihelix transcription factor GT-2-like [Odontomachus brunneus]XP_032671859.1 trihelix transcription factor GT-2-like [Odontomachus brunneus]